jgi:crotonobetainyl-CoA:carnitine CoA-transferase CaiB-like acyl-CoA transferase
MTLPLECIRVVEIATVLAGPGIAKYLADYGADVIKVESPDGDSLRRLGWADEDGTDSYFSQIVGRGKRSIVLNLKQPHDVKIARTLIATADVLIENMRPGKLESLGLAPDDLLVDNPRLVVVRVTGFGQDGPYANRPGFATTAEALGGFAALIGEPGGPPLLVPVAITDEVTAIVGAFATLVAVTHSRRTGEGQVIDVNLLDSILQVLGPLPTAYERLGYEQPRMGSAIPYTVPRGTYQCGDGSWVAVSASAESIAERLVALLGLEHDPRFSTFAARVENREVLDDALRDWISARTRQDVLAAFERADAAIAPVQTMADVWNDPHIRRRECFVEVDGLVMQNVVARLSRTPGRIRHKGRTLGADTAEVLTELAKDASKGERSKRD